MKKKQSETTENGADEQDELAQSGGTSIKDIVSEGSEIDTVKLASVFKAELTEVEQDIIKKRVAQQQRQFELYRKREINKKYAKIRQVYRHVTEQEVEFALQECNDDEVWCLFLLYFLIFLLFGLIPAIFSLSWGYPC